MAVQTVFLWLSSTCIFSLSVDVCHRDARTAASHSLKPVSPQLLCRDIGLSLPLNLQFWGTVRYCRSIQFFLSIAQKALKRIRVWRGRGDSKCKRFFQILCRLSFFPFFPFSPSYIYTVWNPSSEALSESGQISSILILVECLVGTLQVRAFERSGKIRNWTDRT